MTEKKGAYHIRGENGKPAGVVICINTDRDGYTRINGLYMASREFGIDDGRAEMLALKAEGYTLVRGGDV